MFGFDIDFIFLALLLFMQLRYNLRLFGHEEFLEVSEKQSTIAHEGV